MPEVPEELRRFYADDVGGSLDQLRIALLLRTQPDREWDAESVAAALRMPIAPTGMRLFLLRATGVLSGSGTPMRYRYAPRGARIDAMLALIDEVFVHSPETIRALAEDGTRDPLQSFADAFDLRKRNG